MICREMNLYGFLVNLVDHVVARHTNECFTQIRWYFVVTLIHYPFGIIPLMPFTVSFMLLPLSRRYALFTVFLLNKFISYNNIMLG